MVIQGFLGGSEVKASACNARDLGLIPGSGRSPGEGNGNPLPHSCLENPMDRGAWLIGYSPWGHNKSDTTELLHFHFHGASTKHNENFRTLMLHHFSSSQPQRGTYVSLALFYHHDFSQSSHPYLLLLCCCWVSKLCLTLLWSHGLYPPGSSVHGISQATILDWIAISCVSWIGR